jgi:hypothetical protein
VLRQLIVCLTSEPVAWQDAFLAQGGPQLLLNLLTTLEKQPNSENKQLQLRELIRCMLALLRNKRSMTALMENKDVFSRMVLCMDPRSADAVSRIYMYDYFSVLCATEPQHYSRVLEAMEYYRFVKQ